MSRVARYAVQGDGSRSFGVTVRGLRVLVTASDGSHVEAEELAETIAALGPECVTEAPALAPAPEPPPVRKAAQRFVVGQAVWCKVHGAQGWYTVTEVGSGRNAGRIRVREYRGWCPAHNFDAEVAS